MAHPPHPDHDRGLEFDLASLTRRRALGLALGAGTAAALAACTPGSPQPGPGTTAGPAAAASPTPSSAATGGGTTAGASSSPNVTRAIAECGVEIPAETAGPFPGDGRNGPNVLEQSGIVRQDITGSFAGGDSRASGVPMTLTLTILDNASGCRPCQGAAVYVWHGDADGRYSMYDPGLEDDTFLRGVQEADADGRVTFRTVFPGAYSGRWPHVHFEVFDSLDNIDSTGRVLKVSQLALTEAACNDVYSSRGYEASQRNFPGTPLNRDTVFRDDGARFQRATMTGSAASGYTAELTVTL